MARRDRIGSLAPARVGLLGGSFNPAHDGHRHISQLALKHLRLNQVWWLVSPQNPLKPAAGMAALDRRLADACTLAGDRRIVVTDLESRLGTTYTFDTIRVLVRRYPRTRFVWLMGADNLAQIPQWYRWQEIFHMVPIAIFDRASYSFRALGGLAAERFSRCRKTPREAGLLADTRPPAWIYFRSRAHPASATALRAAGHVKSSVRQGAGAISPVRE